MIEVPHPSDQEKLRVLGELLCDASRGRVPAGEARRKVLRAVENLMVCLRDDCQCKGAITVANRILGLADWRDGSEGMSDMAFVEIALGEALDATGSPFP